MSFQSVPLLEYCQAPSVAALAELPTMTTPRKLDDGSGSTNEALNKFVIVSPVGLVLSSRMLISVASLMTGGRVGVDRDLEVIKHGAAVFHHQLSHETVIVPTSPLVGVPENVREEPLKLSQLGSGLESDKVAV